jgi:hypothetical protein
MERVNMTIEARSNRDVWFRVIFFVALSLIILASAYYICHLWTVKTLEGSDANYFGIYIFALVIFIIWALSYWYTGRPGIFALATKPTFDDVNISKVTIATSTTSTQTPINDKVGYRITNATQANQIAEPANSNNQLSLSKLQLLLYFSLIVAAYCGIYAIRLSQSGISTPLPGIPLELLGVLGLTTATTLGSQAVTLQYQAQNRISDSDKSDLIRNRDGNADITKVQMLVWTLVGLAVYVTGMLSAVSNNCYTLDLKVLKSNTNLEQSDWDQCRAVWLKQGESGAEARGNLIGEKFMDSRALFTNGRSPNLPTFDVTLLALAGIVQGTFFAGRVLGTRTPPQLDGVYRKNVTSTGNPAVTQSELQLIGVFTGIQEIRNDNGDSHNYYNFLIEIKTDHGNATLIDLRNSTTVESDPTTLPNDKLDGKINNIVSIDSSSIVLKNVVPAGTYDVRIAIDGIWSEIKKLIS